MGGTLMGVSMTGVSVIEGTLMGVSMMEDSVIGASSPRLNCGKFNETLEQTARVTHKGRLI